MKLLFTATAMLSLTVALAACAPAQSVETIDNTSEVVKVSAPQTASISKTGPRAPFKSTRNVGLEELCVAGGCFWCVEADFEKVDGVKEAISGYTGGGLEAPTYRKVVTNRTGHYEAVKIVYDPKVTSYRKLIDHYWKTVDPTDTRGQFCDKGESYRTAIFATPEQRRDAEKSLKKITASKPFSADIVTPILPAVTFYEAEDYHQDYYKKSSFRYNQYRNGCGRDRTLRRLWGEG